MKITHGGEYEYEKNEISILDLAEENDSIERLLATLYHELLHMASNTMDNQIVGFQDIVNDENGEWLYSDMLDGMSEGFTEYLTLQALGKENTQSRSVYGKQINIMEHLSLIVGLEQMKKAYFNNRNGMQEIEEVLQNFDKQTTHNELYMDIENNFSFGKDNELFEPERLGDIDKKLLILDKQKMQYMQKQNLNLSEEFIKYYWDKVGKSLNTKENLEQIDEEPNLYIGLDEVQTMFKNFSQDAYKSKKEKDIIMKKTQKFKNTNLKGEDSMAENEENRIDDIKNHKKIENILNNDRLIKIYGLLPNKESKKEFLETLLSNYEDRLSERFEQRLEDEFEPSDVEIKQEHLKEDIRNKRNIVDVIRSRKREPLRQGVTERIDSLITELQKGNYISKEDREFLAKNLAERSNMEGTSPSSRREEIRTTIDTY